MPGSAAPRAPGHGGQDLEGNPGSERRRHENHLLPAVPPPSKGGGSQPCGCRARALELFPTSDSLQCASTLMNARHRVWNTVQKPMTLKCISQPLSELSLTNPAVPQASQTLSGSSSVVQLNKWHFQPPSSSCQTHSSHPEHPFPPSGGSLTAPHAQHRLQTVS